MLENFLRDSEFHSDETKFLVDGFRSGFDLEYEGPLSRQDTSLNILFQEVGNKYELWSKIMKEVANKRYAGPFNRIPYLNYVQSAIGLVPKAGGKTRLIFHLSYNFEKSGNKAVNAYTVKEKCTVKYNDLDHAVTNSLKLLNMLHNVIGSSTIWYGKTDLTSAFRVLPLKPSVYWLLIMFTYHPRTGRKLYFKDKCLLFGHSISCALFQCFSNALAHLLKYVMRRGIREQEKHLWIALTNYLDDFLFTALTQIRCNQLLQGFLTLCQKLGVPVSIEKTEWATTVIVFLGVLLDGKNKILGIPAEKRTRALYDLKLIIDKRSATIKQLQSLTRLLNFLCRAIHPSRAFTRCMYVKFSSEAVATQGNKALKQYHHIHLNREFKEDCRVWCEFLEMGPKSISQPFIYLESRYIGLVY